MATREQLIEANKKAVLSPNIGKHGKRKATIEKEKRQAIFDEIVSQEFPELINAARPEYKLDRFMGKVADRIDLTVEQKAPSEEVKELADGLKTIQQRGDTGSN